jgi:hypothetical protein
VSTQNKQVKPQLFEGPTGRRRILKTYERIAKNTFDDLLYACAVTVEDALQTGGARPGVDYQLLDLYRLAMPLAMDFGKDAEITMGIPASHPDAGTRRVEA